MTTQHYYYSLNISGLRSYLMQISWSYGVPISFYVRSLVECRLNKIAISEFLNNRRYESPRRKRDAYPDKARKMKNGRDYIQVDLTGFRQFITEQSHTCGITISAYLRQLIQEDMSEQMKSRRFDDAVRHWRDTGVENRRPSYYSGERKGDSRYLFKLDITGLKEEIECNAWICATSIQNYINSLIDSDMCTGKIRSSAEKNTGRKSPGKSGQMSFDFRDPTDYIYIDLRAYKDFLHSLDIPITVYIRGLIRYDTRILDKQYQYVREMYKFRIGHKLSGAR